MIIRPNLVSNPGTSVDNALARFDLTSGKIIQNGLAVLSDAGALTGTTSIVQGNVTWDNVNSLTSTSTLSITANGDLTINTGPAAANFNIVNFNGGINAASTGDNQFASSTGAVIFSAATSVTLTGTSAGLIFASNSHHGTTSAFFGASDISSISHDGTALIISPLAGGSATLGGVVIGTSSASGSSSPDGNLRVYRLGLFGSDISGSSIVNCSVTGSARQALFFALTFTGGSSSAGPIVAQFTDQGTTASMTATICDLTNTLSTLNHTTVTQTGVNIKNGIANSLVITTGTYTIYGARAILSSQGNANASTSGGTFRRYGFFQDAITAISGSPTSDLIMGCFFNDSINTKADTKVIFDSTSTTLGDSSISYVSASTLLRTIVDGTSVWDSTTTSNGCLVDLTMTDAKNIVVGSTTGTKFGTATTQKIGFFNKAPVVQPAAYTPTNVTTDRSYDANATTIDELADVLGTLIADLQSLGLVG